MTDALSVPPIAIVGAGPYGLSVAAYLAPTGLQTRIFGRPMQSWQRHMPHGMKLKSEGFASCLYDPGNTFPLSRYCRENNLPYEDVGLPVPLETFTAYGIEFQRRLVPHLEQTDIAFIRRTPRGFALATVSGETLEARSVVLAAGITHFEHLPPALANLPPEYLTHSAAYGDLSRFHGRKVAVLGAGSSAVDIAALLADAGADVHLIARAPKLSFHSPGKEPRPLLERLRNPRSGLGVGWKSRLCSDLPLLFHVLPQKLRFRATARHLGPSSGWFVHDKVIGHIPIHLNTGIQSATIENNQVHLTLTSPNAAPETLIVDHLIAGTGYRPAVSRLTLLDEDLRTAIRTESGTPVLSRHFESSVPGLYFIGLAAANAFGPLMRFACGAEFTARHLTHHLATKHTRT